MLARNLILVLVLAAFAFGPAAVRGANIACSRDGVVALDGTCWNALDADEKGSAVLGIWTGIRSRDIANNLTIRVPPRNPKDWIEIPSRTTTTDIVDYFNLLYKTPTNRLIQWEWAYIVAAMKARDDDTDDGLALVSFLRDHSSLPVAGSIYSVVAPDLITIKTQQGMFDVHLEGVTSEGLSSAQREVATAFLRGMLFGDSALQAFLTGRKECEGAGNLPVSLDFRVQLFRGNVLSATVAVDSHRSICLKNRRVQISELNSNDGEPLDLGHPNDSIRSCAAGSEDRS